MSDDELWKGPKEYARSYHAIDVQDSRLGLDTKLNITNYISGWKAGNQEQYFRQLDLLVPLLGDDYRVKDRNALNIKYVPVYFSPPSDGIRLQQALKARPGLKAMWDRINPLEEFYMPSLRRAYEGRASPHEFKDAVRLAIATGLAKNGPHAYAKEWFGLDCNTFVGNWLGISPSSAIMAYAHGYDKWKGALIGATADVYTTKNWLPLPPVAAANGLKHGNVLTTYTPELDSRGRRWRHIGLVEDIQPAGGIAADGTGRYRLSIAEWGTQGEFARHFSEGTHTIKFGKACKEELPNVDFFYIDDTGPKTDPHTGAVEKDASGKPIILAKYRLFFDSSKLDNMPNRGFHMGGTYGT